MINLGNIEISDLRLGASQVKAVYFGSEQVWGGKEPVPPTPTNDWLCFTATQANSTVKLNKSGSPNAISLETSTDGNTWTDYSWTDKTGNTLTLANIGDKVYMRAKTENQTIGSSNTDYYKFVMTGKIAESGNIQTLLKSDGSRTDAPAYCYKNLFNDCQSLTTAQKLWATTLYAGCYSNMFSGCTSLTTAPALPATTLASNCYNSMFNGCTSLISAPVLPATTLAIFCYRSMFANCKSLTTAPELPETTLANNCYQSMFSGCTSLTTAPVLPATTLASNCYNSMFNGCTSLISAPVLPATTLAIFCYRSMFANCKSLTTAPELPATTLARSCYDSMFNGCSNLASIDVRFTSWDPTNATYEWLRSVGDSGTFTCPAKLPDTRGTSNIPEGWTKVDAAPDIFYNEAPTKVYYNDGTSAEYNIVGEADTSNILSASSVQKIEFGNTVTSIADSLFAKSKKLQYVYTGWNCEVINDRTFNDVTSLSTVVFGPGIKSIGNTANSIHNYSFAGAGPILSVVFHDDSQLSAVKYGSLRDSIYCDELVIKSRANQLNFSDWAMSTSSAKKVKVFVFDVDVIPTCTTGTIGTFNGQGFVNGESGCYVVVPDSLVTAWKATSPWSNWASSIISMTEYEAIKANT